MYLNIFQVDNQKEKRTVYNPATYVNQDGIRKKKYEILYSHIESNIEHGVFKSNRT
jgi:hypothetical protein